MVNPLIEVIQTWVFIDISPCLLQENIRISKSQLSLLNSQAKSAYPLHKIAFLLYIELFHWHPSSYYIAITIHI